MNIKCFVVKLQVQRNNGRTADVLRYVSTATNNKLVTFWSEQLQKQIIHQNAQIFKRNWLIPSTPAISIYLFFSKETMTWLQKFFGLFFFQPMARPNRPISWFCKCYHSTAYIFRGSDRFVSVHLCFLQTVLQVFLILQVL